MIIKTIKYVYTNKDIFLVTSGILSLVGFIAHKFYEMGWDKVIAP